MARTARNRRLYPGGTEDGLTFRARMQANLASSGMPVEVVDRYVEKLVSQMEDLVEAGQYRRVITPAGVAAYAPTPVLQAHLEAGGRHPLEGPV